MKNRFPSRARFRPFGLLALFGLLASLGPVASAEEPGEIASLATRLVSDDFRVRVQSALLLGKTADAKAIVLLKKSLADESVAVRAASAAALATLGDPAALPALERAKGDENPAVRRQIEAAIAKLEQRARDVIIERRSARVLVKLESPNLARQSRRAEAIGTAAQASRRALEAIPGIAILNPTEDPGAAALRHKRPALVLQPSIESLETVADGASMVSSARVEFLIQRVPERSIASTLKGDARATAQVSSPGARSELEDSVLGAAVESALRQGQKALLAAAQH